VGRKAIWHKILIALNLRTEEWRWWLLAMASCLEEEDVQWIAAAVDDSSDAPFFCVMLVIQGVGVVLWRLLHPLHSASSTSSLA
jgi:hypothetical protein